MALDTNNNQKIIKHIAKNSLKSARMRNFFTILTIALAISLLTVLTLFESGIKTIERKGLEKSQHAIYNGIDESQADKIRNDERVSYLTLRKQGQGIETENMFILPVYYDGTSTEINVLQLSEGSLPQAIDEVVVDKELMNKKGLEATIGARLPVTFLDGSTETFTISGYTDYGNSSELMSLVLSEEYAEQGVQLKDVSYDALVRIKNAQYMSGEDLKNTIIEVGENYGLQRKFINPNDSYLRLLSPSTEMVSTILITGLGILIVCILVISSIFYLSIVGRIRQFGQFRTIGMTQKQISRLITLEGLLLCGKGITIGLIFGGIVSYLLQPNGWNWSNFGMIVICISIIGMITVLTSINRPAKLASSISPIDAYNYNAYTGGKKETKKLHRRLTPFHLAVMNFERNYKKTILTAISLSLGGILFMTGAIYINSWNLEEYSRQGTYDKGEYIIQFAYNAMQTSENGMSDIQLKNILNEDLKQDILAISGVNEIYTSEKAKIKYEYHNEVETDFITPITPRDTEILKEGLQEGTADYQYMLNNNQIFVTSNDLMEEIYGWRFKVGDKITLNYYNGQPMTETFTIAGCSDNSYRYYDSEAGIFLMPEENVSKLFGDMNLTNLFVISTDFEQSGDEIELQIRKLVDENPLLSFNTLKERMASDLQTYSAVQKMVFGLALFIIMFSLINLLNTLITGIVTRRQELAMLQSVGMGNRQISIMLQYEGLLLAVPNILSTLILGGTIGWGLIQWFDKLGIDYMHFQFPMFYFLCYAGISILAPVIISSVCIIFFQKKSLVERLRESAM